MSQDAVDDEDFFEFDGDEEDFNNDEFPDDEFEDNTNDEDNDFEDQEFGSSSVGPLDHDNKHQYRSLSEPQILEMIEEGESEIRKLVNIPKCLCTLLLRAFKWDKETAILRYIEDSESALTRAGIPSIEIVKVKKNEKFLCSVCLLPHSKSFSLGCQHDFCYRCWKGFLLQRISSGPDAINTVCMQNGCKAIVHFEAFRKFTSQKLDLYRKYLVRDFVHDSPYCKWCPAPNCERAIRSDSASPHVVKCECGFEFCFKCASFEYGNHQPASCAHIQAWTEKSNDESENTNWLVANTKKCPKCAAAIEKNGGCMHMTCRRELGGCGHEFCWLCRDDWAKHNQKTGGYYQCNRYEKSEAHKVDREADKVKSLLDLYMFYFHRFQAHRSSRIVAEAQRETAPAKAHELQRIFGLPPADVQFVYEATDQLVTNRRVLEYSYVMAYYLVASPEKNLYEYLQSLLENHTNKLSELYETQHEDDMKFNTFIKWKEEVTHYTRVMKKHLKKFCSDASKFHV